MAEYDLFWNEPDLSGCQIMRLVALNSLVDPQSWADRLHGLVT